MQPVRAPISMRQPSGDINAWHYPGRSGVWVVMAGGLAATKEPATDVYAAAFNAAGFDVVAFDYRHLGASEGQPRQLVDVDRQLDDWRTVIDDVATRAGADDQIVLWGFSLSGGHVLDVARDPRIAGAICVSPNADGRAAARNQMRHTTLPALMKFVVICLVDTVRGLFGRDPLLIPLTGQPGDVAVLTTPDCTDADRALDPDGEYTQWPRTLAARSALKLASYRPITLAGQVRCPLLVLAADNDLSALSEPARRVAGLAPRASLVRLQGGHYAPFLEAKQAALEAQLTFLARIAARDPGLDEPS